MEVASGLNPGALAVGLSFALPCRCLRSHLLFLFSRPNPAAISPSGWPATEDCANPAGLEQCLLFVEFSIQASVLITFVHWILSSGLGYGWFKADEHVTVPGNLVNTSCTACAAVGIRSRSLGYAGASMGGRAQRSGDPGARPAS